MGPEGVPVTVGIEPVGCLCIDEDRRVTIPSCKQKERQDQNAENDPLTPTHYRRLTTIETTSPSTPIRPKPMITIP